MEPRSAQRVLIAVDINVLLELADEVEEVVEAFDLIQARVPTRQFVMPPTVVHELAFALPKTSHDGFAGARLAHAHHCHAA